MPTDKLLKPVRWPPDMLISKFKPRTVALPAPTAGIFDEPYGCARLNFKWLSHVLGAIQVLLEDDAWEGDANEIWAAQQEIEAFCNELGNPCAILWEGTLLRQNPDDSCQLEQSVDGGATWTLAFDYGLCNAADGASYYTNQLTLHLILESLYDGTPQSIDQDAPNTGFASESSDVGLDAFLRETALCNAVSVFIDAFIANQLETSGIVGSIAGFFGSVSGLWGPGAAAVGFVFSGATQIFLAVGSAPFQNSEAVENVKCALYNALLSAPEITEGYFNFAINSIYPAPDVSHEGQIADSLRKSGPGFRPNYLSFLKMLAQGYRLAKAEILEPCDCQAWEKTFFGGEGDLDGIIASYVYGEYDSGNDWAIGTVRTIAGSTDYLQVWIQVYSSYVMHIIGVRAEIEWNMPVIDTDGIDTYWAVYGEDPPPLEIVQELNTGLQPAPQNDIVDTGEIDLETMGFYVVVVSRHNDGNPEASVARIKSLTISGKGLNPFEVGGGG